MKLFILLLIISANVFAQSKTIVQADYISNLSSKSNMLKNGSLEYGNTQSFSTSGSGISLAIETTTIDENEGKYSVKATLSSSTNGQLINEFTSSSNWSGVQATASCKIKTSLSGIKFCSISGGVEDNCLDVSSSNTWQEYLIPTVASSSSTNGLKVKVGSGTLTGDVYVDGCKYASGLNQLDVGQAQVVGIATLSNSFIASITSGSFVTLNSASTNSRTNFGCATSSTTSGDLSLKCLNQPAGTYEFNITGRFYNTNGGTTTTCSFAVYDASGTMLSQVYTAGVGETYDEVSDMSGTVNYTTSGDREFFIKAYRSSGDGTCGYDSLQANANRMVLKYFPPQSKIISATNQDYDWTAYTPTFTGFGTVTNIEVYHKRVGSDLLIRGKFKTGTSSASTGTMTLPTGLNINTDFTQYLFNSIFGTYHRMFATNYLYDTTFGSGVIVNFGNTSDNLISFQSRTFNSDETYNDNANTIIGSNETIVFNNVRIPIQGWVTPNQVIASVKDNVQMSVPNGKPKICTWRQGSTGTVSDDWSDCISGNCTKNSTGNYTCTFTTNYFSVAPICTMQPRTGGNGNRADGITETSSTVTWQNIEGSATVVDSTYNGSCVGY